MMSVTEMKTGDAVGASVGASTSPPVKLHDIVPQRTTIQCRDVRLCGRVSRIYSVVPSLRVGQFQYCPVCGTDNVYVFMSGDTDYWEAMARDYDLPVEVMKQLYKLWDASIHYRFSDHVAAIRAEIAAEDDATTIESKVYRTPGVPVLVVPK